MSAKTAKFPIGLKLFLLVSFIVITSMGLLTWFIHKDALLSIEKNNFDINRRLAVETEAAFNNIHTDTRLFLQTVSVLGPGTLSAYEFADRFFKESAQIIAVFFTVPEKGDRLYINKQSINESYATSFFKNQKDALERAGKGETVILNAASFFSLSYLALFFPFENASIENAACGVLFSSEFLNVSYNSADIHSFLAGADGNILIYPDFPTLASGANITGEDFFRPVIISRERNSQRIIETEYKFKKQNRSVKKSGYLYNYYYRIKNKILPAADTQEKDRYLFNFTKINFSDAVVITCTQLKKGYDGLPEITKRNIIISGISFTVSLILVIIFSVSITIPLKKLNRLTNQFANGKFNSDIKLNRHDEVGVAIDNLNRISSALLALSRYSNRDVALKAMQGKLLTEGVQKQATIFFSNIHDFNSKEDHFNKMFGAEASTKLIPWLNNYYKNIIENVEKTNGIVDRFFGDSIMAYWGVASTHGSERKDAFYCIKAALLMRKSLFLMNKRHRPGDLENPVYQAGFGINTGSVAAGQLGSDTRAEYSIIGENVKIASKIKSLTQSYGVDILISEYTWRVAGDKFITEEMSPLVIEGREKPVRLFAVINFINEPKGPQNLAELRRVLGIAVPESELLDMEVIEDHL